MIKLNRYKLKKGKFGCYFYDSVLETEMTLEIVLNRLNDSNESLNKLRIKYNKLNVLYLTNERERKKLLKKLKEVLIKNL